MNRTLDQEPPVLTISLLSTVPSDLTRTAMTCPTSSATVPAGETSVSFLYDLCLNAAKRSIAVSRASTSQSRESGFESRAEVAEEKCGQSLAGSQICDISIPVVLVLL